MGGELGSACVCYCVHPDVIYVSISKCVLMCIQYMCSSVHGALMGWIFSAVSDHCWTTGALCCFKEVKNVDL